ncbi:MAG: RNA methyltransferase [Bacteroidales bacterium]
MISRNASKLIRSLAMKKHRDAQGLCMAEGHKLAEELFDLHRLGITRTEKIFATEPWLGIHGEKWNTLGVETVPAGEDELKKVSQLTTPPGVLALVRIPRSGVDVSVLAEKPLLGFEAIRDPGNLGTVVRTAEWFGIRHILCSPDSVDAFSPKVIQASMGAVFRMQVHELELSALLDSAGFAGKPVFGTFLEGKNLYETPLGTNPLILFGNESRGLSDVLASRIRERITIPRFGAPGPGSESLNLAASVAVVCAEMARRAGPIQSGN